MQLCGSLSILWHCLSLGLELKLTFSSLVATSEWQTDSETMDRVTDFAFGAPKSLQMVTAAMKLKDAYSLGEKL